MFDKVLFYYRAPEETKDKTVGKYVFKWKSLPFNNI